MSTKFIYLCGPTVYDKVHIGNLRPIITFDIFIRALKHFDSNIFFIHNLTDVDDKIISRAKNENVSWKEISKKYSKYYLDSLKQLNISSIDALISVSENMSEIKDFIKELVKNNNTYLNNSLYFDTTTVANYGLHSNLKHDFKQTLKNLEKKRNQDFVLWKKDEQFNYFSFENIIGRPGWHSECAAFIYKFSKEPIFIHGGGIDLKFPHHENEIAQFRALTNKPLALNWIYVGIVNLNGSKMSKSENNILSYDDYLTINNASIHNQDVLKMIYFLSSHKSEINFNQNLYNNAFNKLMTLIKIRNSYFFDKECSIKEINFTEDFSLILKKISELNFSIANKLINEKIKQFHKNHDKNLAKQIIKLFDFIGFSFSSFKINWEIEKIYQSWIWFLENKNFQDADQKRTILIEKGVLPYANK